MAETEATVIPQLRQVFRMAKAELDALIGLRDGALGYGTDDTILYRQNGDGAANWEAITTLAQTLICDTEVFNAAAPIAWTDLDLSAVIGARARIVIIKVHDVIAGGRTYAFRKNGDTDEHYNAPSDYGNGLAQIDCANVVWRLILVLSDAAGIIEWMCEIANDTTLDVIGYI